MDKRKEANIRVKTNITHALFALMEKKSLADIHISELVSRAGVARASFYRNYSTKEDVLVTLIRDVLDLYHSGFLSVLMEELNRFHESMVGDMPSSSIEKYQLYIYIGALLNTALVWLSSDDQTCPEDMASFFLEAVSK